METLKTFQKDCVNFRHRMVPAFCSIYHLFATHLISNRHLMCCDIAEAALDRRPLQLVTLCSGKTSFLKMDRRVFLVPVVVRGNSLKNAKRTCSNDGNLRAI
jgi:hypothetical protein